ncbi:MAG: hypothetical protein PSV13_01100 [Lacunisphaera sp.]|nr:hypothetical protein [Lacunisphaera sp.]
MFHFWAATVGWRSNNLPGGEFRQAQTAISTYFIQQEDNFSLAYPTPVLGKPWSTPMEFPLYQWSVAGLSTATGMDLTQAGRAVSLACFYLTLPAIFLLLGHLNIPRLHRLISLGLIFTCPLYIFYARAFLIETMALMFSVWFLVAFIEAVEDGGPGWLVLANLMGIAAGLVKVTTFMLYLLPAGAWGLYILYHSRSTARVPGWKKFLLFIRWIALATAVPFAVTLWWLHFADATKALNPSADFLRSANLSGFNFGFAGARVSGDIWHSLWQVLRLHLVWPPVLAVCLGAVALFGRRWWGQFAICLAVFVGAQLLFPQLYAWHDYYSVASAALLMAALSLGLVALLESRLPHALSLTVITAVFAGQIWLYWGDYYQTQRQASPGGSGLTEALGYLTRPDEVIVCVGDDWSSIRPYYARRRALMIRNGKEYDEAFVTAALASLKGETIGALILPRERPGFTGIIELAERELGIDPRPVLLWHDNYVYLNAKKRAQILNSLRQTFFYEVSWMPGSEPKVARLADEWFEFGRLRKEQRASFELMEPRPVRFFSTFGPGVGTRLGRTWYNAHPDTRLRFALAAGSHQLSAELMMDAATYDASVAPTDMTDGVNIDVSEVRADGVLRQLYTRSLDPRAQPGDRGPQVITVEFTLAQAAEVELFIGSGAHGSNARDWALLGPVKIQ